jgi:hypothetical protein
LLALYPDREKAKQAGESFLRHYLPDAREVMAELADGRWTGCRTDSRLLGIVFNAPDKEALTIYLRVTWPKPAQTK